MPDENTPTIKMRSCSTGPFKNLSFIGHATAEDYDREAGEVGACVEDADASVLYRSTLNPEFHDKFTPILQEMSGIERPVNEKATTAARTRAKTPEAAAKVKDVPASFVDYANNVKATVDAEMWNAIEAKAREVASSMRIDASPSQRVGAVSAEYKAKAQSWLDTGDFEGKITTYAEQYDLDAQSVERDDSGKPTVDSLGRFIKQVHNARMKEL